MMSQYGWQQYLKSIGGGSAASNSSNTRNASDIKKKYYVKGLGWTENEPLVTTDGNGQRVVQTSGLQRQGTIDATGALSLDGGDRLAKAYDYAKGGLGDTLRKWQATRRAGVGLGASELRNLYTHYRDNGVYTGDYAGFENWLTSYLQSAQGETMSVDALMNSRGVATKTADGRLTQAGIERNAANASKSGGTSGSVWQKRFQTPGAWI